jgi:RteC protein
MNRKPMCLNSRQQDSIERLHEAFISELTQINKMDGSDLNKTELSFKCSLHYWDRLKTLVREKGFYSFADEISFFKTEKPRFTGWIEYFMQVYHALLFRPRPDPAEELAFWMNELRKLSRFRDRYAEFHAYYESGERDRDEQWFTRSRNEKGSLEKTRIYDMDMDITASGDWLVSMVVGNDLYKNYVLMEMQRIRERSNGM